MTSKELVQSAIQFNKTPRTPVAVLDGYLWMLKRHNMSFADLFDMDDREAAKFVNDTYNEIGSDILYANSGASGAVGEVLGGKVDLTRKGMPSATIRSARTELAAVYELDAEEVFKKVIVHPVYSTMISQLSYLAEINNDEKYIMSFSGGPLTMCAAIAGMEELMMCLHDDEETVTAALEYAFTLSLRLTEYQIAHGANAISFADPVSSINLISGELFEKYSMPYYKRLTAALKKHNMPIMLHICGDSTTRLELLKDAGIDIFSLDTVDLRTALEAGRGSYAVFGNLHTVEVMQNKSADEVYALSRKLCELADNTGFILAPGCDTPPDTPIENLLAMSRAARGE